MAEKKFVKGFRCFPKKQNQPEWVIGDLVVDVDSFAEFIRDNKDSLTEYQGKRQLKCQITKSRDGGISVSVNDWKPEQQPQVGEIAGKHQTVS